MTAPVSSHTIMTPANVVTVLRILLAPVLVFVIWKYGPSWWVLAFGFIAMFTDRIDGILARRYGTSELGIFLDPLADKIMVLGSFFVVVAMGWLWWVPVAIITVREVAMSYWRSYYARKGVSVTARPLAKLKTWSQSFTIAFCLAPGVLTDAHWIPDTLLWVSVVLTVVTFVQYVFDGRPPINADNA